VKYSKKNNLEQSEPDLPYDHPSVEGFALFSHASERRGGVWVLDLINLMIFGNKRQGREQIADLMGCSFSIGEEETNQSYRTQRSLR
jgi:hypothetical protein